MEARDSEDDEQHGRIKRRRIGSIGSSTAPIDSVARLMSANSTATPPDSGPPPKPRSNRSLRISLIPPTVTDSEFRCFLEGLESGDNSGYGATNVLTISLAPDMDSKVATVCFANEPNSLSACSPGKIVHVDFDHRGALHQLVVDCDFFGLTPLYSSKNPSVDIIAVTGLAGHALGSWKSPGHYTTWLRDFLPLDLPDCRILTYGYDSSVQDSNCKSTIQDLGRQFLQALHTARDEATKRPLIFIGHSLGGIIIIQALSSAAQGHTVSATVGILLFGAPLSGLDHESLRSIAKGKRNSRLICDLMTDSSMLPYLVQNFRERYRTPLSHCRVVSFYETRDTLTTHILSDGTISRGEPRVFMVAMQSATTLSWDECDQVPIDGDHSTIVKFSHRSQQSYKTVLGKLKEVANNRTSNASSQINQTKPSPAPQTRIPFMVPYSRNKLFVGQQESRKTLDEALGPDDEHRRLAVWGLGGAGKTQTVLDYVYQFRHQKPVFWVHAGSRAKFEEDYRKLAQLVLLPNHDDSKVDIRPLVRDWLEREESGNWILVLDNADNYFDFFPKPPADDGIAKFIPYGSKGTVLVTTRDEVVGLDLCENEVLHKEAMNEADATILFKNSCPRIGESQTQTLNILLKELSYLPLAIIHAASYLRQNRLVTVKKYLERYQSTKEERLKLLSKPFANLRRNQDPGNLTTVLTTFTISFQQIEEQSPLANSLLRVIACVNRQAIPIELLQLVEVSDCTETVEEAINRLISFSLLTANLESEGVVEMHAFIHLSVQVYLSSRNQLRREANKTAELLVYVLPGGDVYGKRLEWRNYAPHASALIDMLEELGIGSEIMEEGNSLSGPRGAIDINLGIECAVNVSDALFRVYRRLGNYYIYTGQYVIAESAWLRAHQISVLLYGDEVPLALVAKGNLALAYGYQKRWKEAEKLVLEVLEVEKIIIGKENPNILISLGNLVRMYSEQGRLWEAEKLGFQVMETMKRVLGEDHPGTLTIMGHLTWVHCELGRWKEAEELGLQVMEGMKRIFGEEHPETLGSINELAWTYCGLGRWKEAEELGVQALEAKKRILGEEHPKTLSSMGNLVRVYCGRGRIREAEKLGLQVMETMKRVLGEDHPGTLTIMGHLTWMHYELGRWKEAEELGLQVMEGMKRIFGDGHPTTLTTMNNLAYAFAGQRRLSEAISLMQRTVELSVSPLGESHPRIVSSMEAIRIWEARMAVTNPGASSIDVVAVVGAEAT